MLSVLVAVPLGYLMARHRFPGRQLVDAILDIPIVLPPLVVGLSLLILFQFPPFSWLARSIVYQVPAVILAQFAVACAFAVRTMKATFDHIDPRCEQVALSLGCSRVQAFGWVVLPEAGRGIMTALTLAWARSLGEFGPLLIFAGATRMKTEVLSTSVFLEMNVGHLEAAVAVSLIMVVAAVIVLIVARLWGSARHGAVTAGGLRMIVVDNCLGPGGRVPARRVSLRVPTGGYGVLMGKHGIGQDDAAGADHRPAPRQPAAGSGCTTAM